MALAMVECHANHMSMSETPRAEVPEASAAFDRKKIEEELAAARQRLLDLTMRNRLLNYRPSKARSIRVVDEIPREVYELLVIDPHSLEFRGRAERTLELETSQPSADSANGNGEIASLWRPPADEIVTPRHTDRFLETSLDSEGLLKRLFYVRQESESVLEEQGYSILYLALGFLVWKESQTAVELRTAPLILVPVELERGRTGGFTKIRWTGEDVFPNVSLQAKLAEQGVSLPSFEMPDEKSGID